MYMTAYVTLPLPYISIARSLTLLCYSSWKPCRTYFHDTCSMNLYISTSVQHALFSQALQSYSWRFALIQSLLEHALSQLGWLNLYFHANAMTDQIWSQIFKDQWIRQLQGNCCSSADAECYSVAIYIRPRAYLSMHCIPYSKLYHTSTLHRRSSSAPQKLSQSLPNCL